MHQRLRRRPSARAAGMSRPNHPPQHYAVHLRHALHYIEQHLASPIDLDALASAASFSRFHFHRVFCQWHGETPQAYIRRQRLERSAALLQYACAQPVSEIALDCGFLSPQAFNRAFRGYFGMTPTAWREGGHHSWRRNEAAPVSLDPKAYPVQRRQLAPVRAVYTRKLGPYGGGEAAFWEEFAARHFVYDQRHQSCYGIGLDDPAVTPEAHCRYDACRELPPHLRVPDTLPVREISGGSYAVLRYDGPAFATRPYWLWLLQVWLPASGYDIGQQSCFEHYPNGIPVAGQQISSELCLPLVR